MTEKRKFEAVSGVGFFGAPISWVALFGALIGALSIVPVVFYSTGGGFISAGMALVAPACGILMGPWAGAIAGTIGGVIGMMISPGAYPGGVLDIVLSGTLVPFSWGIMQPKYYKFLLLYYPVNAFMKWFFPYHWPAEAIGVGKAQEPAWIIAHHWVIIGLVLFAFAPMIWRLYESADKKKMVLGLFLNTYLACTVWKYPYIYWYNAYIRSAYEQSLLSSSTQLPLSIGPVTLVATAIGFFLVRALRKGNLRVIPNSWIDGFNFKWEP